MKKYYCDRVGIALLAIGVVVLPCFQGRDSIRNYFLSCVVCGSTIFLILLTKIIGYKTGYTPKEIKEDRSNFIILSIFLIFLLVAGIVLWMYGL